MHEEMEGWEGFPPEIAEPTKAEQERIRSDAEKLLKTAAALRKRSDCQYLRTLRLAEFLRRHLSGNSVNRGIPSFPQASTNFVKIVHMHHARTNGRRHAASG
jgi:hypothetical protein